MMQTDVAVIMLAYNHSPWIRYALDGIVNQKTTYKMRVYVHDDASTDNTRNIIEEYVEKYPGLFIPIYQDENQYSKRVGIIKSHVFPLIESKYIAFCECDDYWCDPLKIQKQLDYMQENPRCTFTFSNAKIIDTNDKVLKVFYRDLIWNDERVRRKIRRKNGSDFDIEDIIRLDFTPTASGVCRYEAYKKLMTEYPSALDLLIRIVTTNEGYAHFFNEIFVAYRTGNEKSASGTINDRAEKLITNYYERHSYLYDVFDKQTNTKYSLLLEQMKHRKHLQCYLDFLSIRELKKFTAYKELSLNSRAKLYLKKLCPHAFLWVKKMINGRK